MKHYILTLLCALLCLSCSDKDETTIQPAPPAPPTPPAHCARTVLIYCVAQNDLGISTWRSDSTEIARGSQYMSEDDCLLVYVDKAQLPRIYLFTSQIKGQLVYQYPDDYYSTNPEQLGSVIEYMIQHYPANEYGLVCWSHSDGWIPSSNTNYTMSPMSFGIDVGPTGNMNTNLDANGKVGSQMNINEMAAAIENTGIHFRYIFFDSCLMQCIETCYDLRHATDYVIGSPMPIPYDGAYYTNMIRKGLFSDSVEHIVDTYYEDVTTMRSTYDDYGLVISSVKTDGLEELADAVKDALANVDWENNYPDMQSVDAYYRYLYSYFYRPHYYDLKSSIKHLCAEADYETVCKVLDKVVTNYKATSRFWVGPYNSDYTTINTEFCCGVSMFVPQAAYNRNASLCDFGNHNENFKLTEWAQAIGKN